MPHGSVRLIPGINVEKTPTLNEAGISSSQLIRFREGLVQKYGGWSKFYAFNVAGTPRDLHAWQDLNGNHHLLSGTTGSLDMITSGSLISITPQEVDSSTPPNFSTIANSTTVTITDPNISNLSSFDSVMINTPVSIGTAVISGLYTVTTLGGTSYKINIATAAGATVNNAGSLPLFQTATTSNIVSVNFTAHGLSSAGFINVAFQATTSLSGVTIFGIYPAIFVDANNFTINVNSLATGLATGFMNNGSTSFQYFINLGPSASGAGYGTGGYGAGGYGTGVAGSFQTGTPITATDWTSDNWGEIALANPSGGAIYQFDPTGGFNTASIVPTAPPFNGGIFISNSLQILFAWGSTTNANIGQSQDPMLVRWSDQGDYTQFKTSTTNQAGSFRIPIGSEIRGGMAVSNQNLFWTDLDLWAATYKGFPLVFGFNKIGAGAGLISSHGAQQFRGSVYWMGASNFYAYDSNGVSVIPCTVWDFVFQNSNTSFLQNVRAMPNTPYNEVGWLFPSSASVSGECDSYVKMNVTEPTKPWDYGTLSRSAWMDQTILGPPIAATPSGIIYQQETTNDADGQPITASFTTGYFVIGEGEDFAFVDVIIPDFKFSLYGASGSAQIQMTFNVVNYPGDTPTGYGPYVVTSTTEFISVRFRGRQMSITVTSSDQGSFWRIGKVRYRYAPSGRN
jgi:hypothetical protein